MMSTALRCACSECVCEVESSTAVVRDGQHFCSDACATGHPNQEPCHGTGSCGCKCSD
ncbi:MAG: conjugal transfer protein TrbI [Synechococcus sp. EAC657]|nr:conjugal transfer protein TrbI [Synechococcus sp. EAC657]MEC7249011.1 conjugal transfer protein TrbI [Cyanobacteriota bacterium]MEC7897686.1 conjugal transfer protein TrbI [Cyanobacteriota bacterium]